MNFIASIAAWLQRQTAASSFRLISYAFAFGFAAALAMPPVCFFPVLAISFPALIILLQTAPHIRAAFLIGWSFAFGYFLLGLYWVAAAMFVDIAQFWWAVPLAVCGLPAVCAIYYGLAAVLAWRIGVKRLSGALLIALIWFLADYARGHLLTGFPWNLEGLAWSGLLPMMQIVSVIGIYGLTLITLVAACLPAALFDHKKLSRFAVVSAVVFLVAVSSWGSVRLASNQTSFTATRVRVVQPNIQQAQKWSEVSRQAHFQQLLDLTGTPAEKTPNLIVWPETAATYYLEEDPNSRRAIASRLSDSSILLTGVIRRNLGTDGRVHFTNSLVAVDSSAKIEAAYDKSHLVPFGEYIPFRKIIPIRTLANLGIDFSAGKGLHTLRLDGVPAFSPLICYEGIFSGEVARRDDRPNFLVNVTNDGWYGHTAGPYQHFASVRVRAIEEGLPLVRSANTGISGVIDAYGRIIAKLDLGKTGFVDADLPVSISPTYFVRFGEKPLWGVFVILLIVCGVLRKLEER